MRHLGLIVFICGGATMVLELTGSRILAPYLGTSTLVWTSLIGIILGFLSAGYWFGGRLSDRQPEPKVFSALIFAAACSIGILTFIHTPVLLFLQARMQDLRWATAVSATLLFGPASFFLGAVSPYAIRLKNVSLDTTGRTAGTLGALSTLGSIVGTFLAGFFLLAYFGSAQILAFLTLAVGATSALAWAGSLAKKAAIAAIFIGAAWWTQGFAASVLGPDFIDASTAYNRIWIYDRVEEGTGRPMRMMRIANEYSSAMYLDSDELAFDYTKFYRLDGHFVPGLKSALMIGGAAYSYPKDFLSRNADARMDVVEIDPGITELARRYFGLKDDPRLRIIHEDGRTFLNRNREQYDVIYVDAFKSIYALPYQLTTVEAARRISDSLSPRGAALVNVISSIEGGEGEFLRAELSTYRKVFPRVLVIPVVDRNKPLELQNILLVALKSPEPPKVYSKNPEYQIFLRNIYFDEITPGEPLTDDFAPIDAFMLKMLERRVRHGDNPVAQRWETRLKRK